MNRAHQAVTSVAAIIASATALRINCSICRCKVEYSNVRPREVEREIGCLAIRFHWLMTKRKHFVFN